MSRVIEGSQTVALLVGKIITRGAQTVSPSRSIVLRITLTSRGAATRIAPDSWAPSRSTRASSPRAART
jgi:hypothetical protein